MSDDTTPAYQIMPRWAWNIMYYVMLVCVLLNVLTFLVELAIGLAEQDWHWGNMIGSAVAGALCFFLAVFATVALDMWDETNEELQ